MTTTSMDDNERKRKMYKKRKLEWEVGGYREGEDKKERDRQRW